MARATQAQKAKRLNAAYRLLARRLSLAEAAAVLSEEEALSLRHAYRYLEQAAQLEAPLVVAQPPLTMTFKIPADVSRALRVYAAAHDLTLSEAVTHAITAFVSRAQPYAERPS